jgi:hypothetical protein
MQIKAEVFSVQATGPGGTPVTRFSQPFVMTVVYGEADVTGVDEASLRLSYWAEGAAAWVAIPTQVDAASNTLTAVLDRPATFAVAGTPQSRLYLLLIRH